MKKHDAASDNKNYTKTGRIRFSNARKRRKIRQRNEKKISPHQQPERVLYSLDARVAYALS